MRRLNVQFTQIEECIRTSLFAADALPKNPPLEAGEILLLQLVKTDAAHLGKLDSRIEFALVFERAEPDPTGAISLKHWPAAGKSWKYVFHCSRTIPTAPFSLENLSLSRDYGGQTQAIHIAPADELRIRPFIQGTLEARELSYVTNPRTLLQTIRNYDQVARLGPVQTSRVAEYQRRINDPWLGDALKVLYDHRCQVCTHDFRPRWGQAYADTRFVLPLNRGGEPVSSNIVVVCPNHDAIIDAASGVFDREQLAYRFPNGLVERIMLRDHLIA
jgi:hypothetical protein